MSEREFESYLTLLCRLLRLDGHQREAIARELRDHLEERLAELEKAGVAHDEAVRLALDEFGDAAGLAADFSSIARTVRRRWIMRATLGTAVATAALVMMAMALWPDAKQSLPLPLPPLASAIAQEAAPADAPGAAPGQGPAVRKEREDPLVRRVDADFVETPLADVLEFISDAVDGQIYVNQRRLAVADIPLDTPLTLRLKNVRADMLLDLALRQVSDSLAYVVRDGIVIVSTLDDLEGAAELRVYNVRDLIALSPVDVAPAGEMSGMMGSMAPPSGAAPPGMGSDPSGYGPAGGYGGGMMMAGGESSSREFRAYMLVQLIKTVTGEQHWDQGGEYGAIAAYDGLLVVNHNTRVHQQVERLLEMLRAAAQEREQPVAPIAPGANPIIPGTPY